MSDDRAERTSGRRRRGEANSVSGKCVACASSLVAGLAGIGLPWLQDAAPPATGAATRVADIELTTSADPLADPFMNQVIVLPGADDTIVLPSGNVVNFPFGGDGFNNFFGPGLAGAAGGAGTTDIATGNTWTEFNTPVEQFTIPFLNDTIVLPGSNDTIVYLSNTFSGNVVNLPFAGDGANDFFGSVFPGSSTALSNAGLGTGNPDNGLSIPTEALPTNAIVWPGSADTIVFPSFNTINFPLGGVGENNFFGGGNGGDGGVGTGIGIGGDSAAITGGTTTDATATSNADSALTVWAEHLAAMTAGDPTLFPGAGQTIVLPSYNTIDFPFGGVGENNFFGGGNGGNGGAGTGIGIGGSGGDTSGAGVGIGGAGGDGGNGAQFFPVYINFTNTTGATSVAPTDVSDAGSGTSTGSLDSFLSDIFGSDGSSPFSIATGTGIGIGGIGGDGGNGAEIFPINIDVNMADLGSANSSALVAYLDSLLGGDSSSTVASLVEPVSGDAANGTGIGIDGAGGAGGNGAEFLPIYLEWADSSGAHSTEVTPAVLLDSLVVGGVLGGGATDQAAMPASILADLGSSSVLGAGDLGAVFGADFTALMADLGSLF